MKKESKRPNLSHKDRPSTKSIPNPNQEMKSDSYKTHGKPDQIKQYVNELLEFLGQINWEINGINQDKVKDPGHPFGSVFDAIERIKWDLDDLNRQRERVEQESHQSEELFRRIVESSPMGMHMYRLESDGRLVFTGANPAADIILGVDNKQFVGKTIEEAFPALVKTEVPDHYRQVCVRGKQWKTEQIDYKDNQIQGAFEVHAFQTSPNNMAAMFFDTTARKKAEEALLQSEKKMGRSGTGLGMAVVYGTIQDHKGYIEVQSKKGKGTVFTLYFPVTKKDISKVDTNLPISDYKGDGQSILVIDDVKEQREIASSMLSQLGYSVSTVPSGEEAIKYMSDNTADLLVLDMIMDPGIDGLDTYKKILDLHPKQKVILASGYSETNRVKEALNLGAGKYIKKPYTVKDISVAVMEELAGKGGELHLT